MRTQTANLVARDIVIIVDDDPAVCNSLKFSLELEGFAVRTHTCASELLESTDASLGKCLVIDHKMPGMTGLDLIAELRSRHITTPAILITTHPGAILRDLAARAHVPIVEKPLLTNTLIDEVRHACTQDGDIGR